MHFYSKSFFKYLFMVKTSEKYSLPYKFTLTQMLQESFTYLCPLIVLFKSLRNSKRRNKENYTSNLIQTR